MSSKKFFDIYPLKRSKEEASGLKKDKKERPVKPLKEKKKPSFLKKTVWSKSTGVFILISFVGLIIFLHLSARAEIEIWPKTEDFFVQDNILIYAGTPQSDVSEEAISGLFLSKEKTGSQQFTSTGKAEEKYKSSGQIRVYNNYNLPQTLVATTRFISAYGKLFRSKETVHIAAGQYLDVEVEAAEAGPDYNIKPNTFSIPGLLGSPRYTAVYGKSFSSMEGGYIGEVAQVQGEDLEKAKNTLYQEVSSALKKELKEMAGSSSLLLDEAIRNEILEDSCSHQAGEKTEEFKCSLVVRAEALAFPNSELQKQALQFLSQNMEESKTVQEDTIKTKPTVEEVDFEEKTLNLGLEISARIFSDIDIVSLKQVLQGKSLKESEALLRNYSEITKTRIRLFPFWLQDIPRNTDRIKVRLKLDVD